MGGEGIMARARRRGAAWRVAAVLAMLQLLAAGAEAGKYRAVFNFGDSLVDAGNLVTEGIPDYLATARLPYGQTYFGYPTGRCSDGRLVIDFIGFYKQLPRACCGAPGSGPYNFNLTAKCGEPGAKACADPKTHWSWDGIHLTEAAYGHIARGWLRGPFADQPIVQSS